MRTDDPIRDFWEHEREADQWLKSRPKCRICGEHIQDNVAFHEESIGWICDDCMNEFRRFIDG